MKYDQQAAPRNLLYLINPVSGTKRKAELINEIESSTKNAGLPYEIVNTRADGDYQNLLPYIRNQNITDVIVCGGDGSVSTVTSWLLNIQINVGIIPTGSGNGLALAARIPYSTKKALDVIFQGYASMIDGFRVNGKFSCMMCGIGNDAEIAHEFALTKVRGLKTYLKLSLKKYFTLKPYDFTLLANGISTDFSAFFITISNSNQFGNYVTIAPRASLTDGLLDVVVVQKMNRLLLPLQLFRQIYGINKLTSYNTKKKRPIVYFQTQQLRIINHGAAPLHIDGEPHPAIKDIYIEIVPNAFRLLQPSPRK